MNTPGAGGDFTGREARRPLGDQDWEDNSFGQQGYQGDNTATTGKASMGDRVKGRSFEGK